jgi:hypothetical protein
MNKPVYSGDDDINSFSSSSSSSSSTHKNNKKYNTLPHPNKKHKQNNTKTKYELSDSSDCLSVLGQHKKNDPDYNPVKENAINEQMIKSITRAVIKNDQKVVLFLEDLKKLIKRMTGAKKVIVKTTANRMSEVNAEVGCCGNVKQTTQQVVSGGGLMKITHISIYMLDEETGRETLYGMNERFPWMQEKMSNLNISTYYCRIEPKRKP